MIFLCNIYNLTFFSAVDHLTGNTGKHAHLTGECADFLLWCINCHTDNVYVFFSVGHSHSSYYIFAIFVQQGIQTCGRLCILHDYAYQSYSRIHPLHPFLLPILCTFLPDMRSHQYRTSLPVLFHIPLHFLYRSPVQTCKWFIQQQNITLRCKSPCNGNSSFHPTA